MLELGKKQRLQVVKKVDFGVYLAEEDGDKKEDRVLLPAKQVPEGAGPGTELEVFLYKDSSDRLIATTREPRLTLGETALLTVAEVGRIGAFLDWGLEKDLLLPYREQTGPVKKGDQVLAALYIDKSHKIAYHTIILRCMILQLSQGGVLSSVSEELRSVGRNSGSMQQ